MSSRPENNDLELRMRTCERCGVGLGTMPRNEYLERFVRGGEMCPSCHKSALFNGERKSEAWVRTCDLAKKYDVSETKLINMVAQNLFPRFESEYVGAGLPRYFLRERDVAKQFAVRA